MAKAHQKLSINSPGPFYVDSSCINCGSCWQLDPQHFRPGPLSSYVHQQPKAEEEINQALLALQDCPVAAIGAPKPFMSKAPSNSFPILLTTHIAGKVYYCGWSSKRSVGASSWLVQRSTGNLLIDSPRWSAPLARQITTLGGIQKILLTHRDDVADHAHWAKAFACERWIHQNDADAAPESERIIQGIKSVNLDKSLKIIPTPGHTEGSMVMVLGRQEQILFSGDHLWWDPQKQVVVASKKYCWWNWEKQLLSVEKLLDLDIAWLLPGHGHAHFFQPGEWKTELKKTLDHALKS